MCSIVLLVTVGLFLLSKHLKTWEVCSGSILLVLPDEDGYSLGGDKELG